LVESHPHIGTNRLPAVVTAMRETVEAAGGVVHFDTRVTGLIREKGRCGGVKAGDQVFRGEAVVLATGHSARDVFHMMVEEGLEVEAKPFALGVRVEHPQGWVDEVQYHGETVVDRLPPASYSLVCQVEGARGAQFLHVPWRHRGAMRHISGRSGDQWLVAFQAKQSFRQFRHGCASWARGLGATWI
jgi:hypothetical protein